MKEFKGTKGPWFGVDVHICNQDKAGLQIGFLSTSSDERREQGLRNAKLIAASPCLLSALQHLIEVYDSEDGKQWTATSKREAIVKAREAIDNALGE